MTRANPKRALLERKMRYQLALDRPELRIATTPRRPAASPTSFPIKAEDPDTRRIIDEALARRQPS
jgi:hypothetical protein